MEEYCKRVNLALSDRDYHGICGLLSLYGGHQLLSVKFKSALSSSSLADIVRFVSVLTDELWREVFFEHLRASMAVLAREADAYEHQLDCVQTFLRILQSSSSDLLPVLYQVITDLWRLAHGYGQQPTTLERDETGVERNRREEEAARAINRAFTLCVTDRNQSQGQSRKMGTFKVLNLLLKIYFARQQLNLCTQLFRALEKADLPALSLFPKAEIVTYKYYHGRFLFVSERYCEAAALLSSALELCAAGSKRNARRILHLLIPCNLLVASSKPKKELLEEFGMPSVYHELLDLLACGTVNQYRLLVYSNYPFFAGLGALSAYIRLENLLLRNQIRLASKSLGSTKIPLRLLAAAFGYDSVERLAVLLASLITKGAIRGYISMQPPYLVLSAKEPCPKRTMLL